MALNTAPNAQPTLQTPRLKLIPLAEEHIPFEIELDSNPLVTQHLFPQPRDKAQVLAAHIRRMSLAAQHPGHGFWVAFLRTDGETADADAIGWFSLQPPGPADESPDAIIGWRLVPAVWRRGYATEGARAVVHHAFTQLGAERVLGETLGTNAASRAMMAKLGMKYVRNFAHTSANALGGEEGWEEFALTRAEWDEAISSGP